MSDAPISPCVGVCSLDAARRICAGCRRTGAEIAAWSTLSPAERRAIIERLQRERPEAPPA
ncbi:MAG: DUF1289 domain-containing protein [Rhodospirillales bacterium]|nr:DUF1289 domain-containing protein [Rhodospirillales bacterium]